MAHHFFDGSASDLPDIDDTVRLDLIELLGDAGVSSLLEKLSAQLTGRLEDERLDTSDRKRLASDAHAMVSAAGMLGFSRFSALCAQLENACHDDLPLDQIRADVKSARDRVATAIAAGRLSVRPAPSDRPG